ncbi:MAG: fibronectin type III domain-containing protein, partial [Dehalococcoidia bacterium]
MTVDSTGAVYTAETSTFGGLLSRVQKFTKSAGPPGIAPEVFGSTAPPPVGAPNTFDGDNNVRGVTIGSGDTVLVTKRAADGLTPVCLDGMPSSPFELRIQELPSDGSTLLDTHGVCSGIGNLPAAANRTTGELLLPTSTNPDPRIYILGDPSDPAIDLDPPVQTASNALITGTVNPTPTPSGYPNPPRAFWHIEYRETGDADWIRFRVPINAGSGTGAVPYQTTLTGLLANTEYEVRAVANKEFNSSQSISQVRTFTTDTAPPAVISARSSDVSSHSANLHAKINPRGSETTYHFEYGTTPEYGNRTPEQSIGDGQGGANVADAIEGLTDVTYHFRVVATNVAGTTVSENQTFTFRPPNCPNANIRQQTGASYLPDCRAYELVSPGQAGNTVLQPWIGPAAPDASNPSRLAYGGAHAPLPVSGESPNILTSIYV